MTYKPLTKEMDMSRVLEVINEIKGVGGESYSEKGCRNPIRDDTGEILKALVIACRPRIILELGTAYGLSMLWMASGMDGGHAFTVEYGEDAAKKARENFVHAGFDTKVTVLTGDAGDHIDQVPVPQMVFIDHEKASYKPHTQKILARAMTWDNVLIVADNVTDRYKECGDFVDWVKETAVNWSLVPTECGLLVATMRGTRSPNRGSSL